MPDFFLSSEVEDKIRRMLYLMATGYADDAGVVARELATWAYDCRLDRKICEHTGNVYFHECYGCIW